VLLQMLRPAVEFRRGYSKADVLRTARPMSRHIAGLECFPGVEQEQHPIAAAKENVPRDFRDEQFQPEDIAVKSLAGGKIIHVKSCFENALNLHYRPRCAAARL
jgi:hypothetical protein